jgi:3-oxoacyl-[acyl-carrier-protein] synthase II
MVEGLRRVVVTGLGAVTPIGNDVAAYWQGLSQGRNGVEAITLFDASRHACRFAAEVKEFDPTGLLEPKEAKRWDRFCQFGVVAAKQAVAAAGLEIDERTSHRVGVAIGSGVGGLLMMETQAHVLSERGPDRVSPFCVPMMIPNMATGLAAIALGARGPSSAVATACAAGSNAIGDAFRLIQMGYADAMVCGGAESAITPACWCWRAWSGLRLVAPQSWLRSWGTAPPAMPTTSPHPRREASGAPKRCGWPWLMVDWPLRMSIT